VASVIETLRDEISELESQVNEMKVEFAGKRFDDAARAKWNELNESLDDKQETLEENVIREERVRELSNDDSNVVPIEDKRFQTRRANVPTGEAIYDLSTIQRDWSDPEVEGKELKDRAKRAIEDSDYPYRGQYGHESYRTEEDLQGSAEDLIMQHDTREGLLARRILVTGAPAYKRAWGKQLLGEYLTTHESQVLAMGTERALSLTTTAGGFAVPFTLDPTVIRVSNLAVNPFRAISRVIPVPTDDWKGVASTGITAAFGTEAAAATDSAPAFTQPSVSTEKAFAFVPYSIEIGMDWDALGTEMGGMLADAKDELEASKFAVGTGTNEPKGVVTAISASMYTAAATNAIVYADLDGLEAALPPRFRSRAVMVANRATYQKIRHFDSAGGRGAWEAGYQLESGLPNAVPTPGSLNGRLLGYPAYEASAMSSTFTTGQLVGPIIGDFRNFIIVDRIGLTTETIPHLFDTTNNMPTGQRGLYAYWRTGSGITTTTAAGFKILKLA